MVNSNKQKLLISFSGGRTSAFMTNWIIANLQDKYEMIVVFANTGKEREETLEFVKECSDKWGWNVVWVEAIVNQELGKGNRARVVNFETASRNGEPFEAVIQKFGLPNQNNPSCSRDLKKVVINAYLKSIGWRKFFTAIGIRADETGRINWAVAKKERLIYPLVTMVRTTKSDINKFWSQQTFDLRLKSYEGNCDLCWKKSMRKLMTIAKDNPELTDWWKEMEEKYENRLGEARQKNPNVKLPLRFFRGNASINDIIEDAKFPFEPAVDESNVIDKFKQIPLWSEDMDSNVGCIESCEAF